MSTGVLEATIAETMELDGRATKTREVIGNPVEDITILRDQELGHKQQHYSRDLLIPLNTMTLENLSRERGVPWQFVLHNEQGDIPLSSTRVGRRGLLSRSGPARLQDYVFHCMEQAKDDPKFEALARANVNAWLTAQKDDQLVRVMTDENNIPHVRGCLSNTYGVLNDDKFFELLLGSLEQLGLNMRTHEVHRDHFREITRVRLLEDNGIGFHTGNHTFHNLDHKHFGLDISQSECGLRAVRINLFVYDRFCENGVVITISMGGVAIKHTGDMVVEKVKRAIDQVTGTQNSVMTRIDRAINTEVEDVDKLFKTVNDKTNLGKTFLASTKSYFEDPITRQPVNPEAEGVKVSLWDVIQATTRASQEVGGPQQAIIEEAAGQILQMA